MRTFLALCVVAAAAFAAEKRSPFTEVRFDGDTPLVEFEDEWYELLELEGLEAGKIVGFCRKTYGGRWEKRFAEDLVEVLEGMGRRPGRKVELVLKSRETGRRKSVRGAAMTEANRRKVWEARQGPSSGDDMAFLKDFLERYHSYRFRFPGSLDRFDEPAGKDGLALAIARRLAPFGDGHTRVRGRWGWLPKGYAPFAAVVSGGRLVAMRPGERALLDDRYPYLRAIDGVPVGRWIEAAQTIIAQGSPQSRLWTGAEYLGFLAFLRGELGLEASGEVRVELGSESSMKTRTLRLRVASRPAPPVHLPEGRAPEGVGYLRIREMDDSPGFLAGFRQRMEDFRDTRGLVLDVRGNGGGSRAAIRVLLPHLLDAPRVVNVAKYRLPDEERPERAEGHLEDRFLYPLTWSGWVSAEKKAIEAFAKAFEPEWEPPAEPFTSWHYMVVSPSKEAYRYEKPVFVLMDTHCFSATDIFLAAFKGVPGVTLVGTPSGGGSGRSRTLTLPQSGVRLRVSSMASFQPDGRLYDGNGVAPDILVEPTVKDWLGETDTMLDAALKRLNDG